MPQKPTYEELEQKVKELEKKDLERQLAGETLQQRTHDLGERVKELNCLYGISNLVDNPDISLEDIFQGIVDIIPPSWQYPEITCSRIILEDEEYKTVNFKETGWKQSSEIFVTGKRMGTLEVFYLEERPEIYEGPFLREERNLIDEITDRLGIIIERKQTDETLLESEKKYRTILKSIEDGYFEVNQRGEITFFNEAFSKITGYPPDELMGMKNDKYLDQENRKKVFKKFNEVWKTGIPTKLFEYEIIRKNGKKRTVQTSASLATDENGRKIGFRGIINDVTERKIAEEVSKKVDALETSNVVIGNFVSDALGNLISPIYGRIQMIIEIRDNIDEIKRDLKDTEKGLAKFLTGINAFREYFRFGERPMKERISTDISHTLSTLLSGQVLETYGKDEFPIYPKVKLRFTYDPKQEEALDLNKLPYVVGHESDITKAIQETLINAIESYDPEKGGEVVVSAKRENDYLILEIADQGRGMSPDEAEKSQLPFYKILGVKGSARFGLGAYIANESAKHCEGGIDIESTEGVGTTASILLKASDQVF